MTGTFQVSKSITLTKAGEGRGGFFCCCFFDFFQRTKAVFLDESGEKAWTYPLCPEPKTPTLSNCKYSGSVDGSLSYIWFDGSVSVIPARVVVS